MSLSFFIKKLCMLLFSLVVIISLTFLIMKIIPGDPLSDERGLPKETYDSLRRHYGLDKPLAGQFLQYWTSLMQGDLGPSFVYPDRTVNQIIRESFPVSATLGIEALLFALSAGIVLGTLGALYVNRWPDYLTLIIAAMGISIPSFILAVLLQYVFAIKLGILPVARWGTFSQSLLPAICLAALPTAFIARLVRTNMIEVLQKDYIKCAKAKGLKTIHIIFHHALNNTLTPLLGYFGQLFANILTGSFVIEKIFGIPGLGQWFVNGVSNRDYTVIMGTTIFYSLVLLTATFLSDTLSRVLDPRLNEKIS
jgi:oligopeptide transport system permease protein